MPLYEFKCPNDHKFNIVCSIADYKRDQNCLECNAPASRIYSPPYISVEYIERVDYSKSLGVNYLSNKRELKETLKEKGLVEGSAEDRASARARNESLKEKKKDTGSIVY